MRGQRWRRGCCGPAGAADRRRRPWWVCRARGTRRPGPAVGGPAAVGSAPAVAAVSWPLPGPGGGKPPATAGPEALHPRRHRRWGRVQVGFGVGGVGGRSGRARHRVGPRRDRDDLVGDHRGLRQHGGGGFDPGERVVGDVVDAEMGGGEHDAVVTADCEPVPVQVAVVIGDVPQLDLRAVAAQHADPLGRLQQSGDAGRAVLVVEEEVLVDLESVRDCGGFAGRWWRPARSARPGPRSGRRRRVRVGRCRCGGRHRCRAASGSCRRRPAAIGHRRAATLGRSSRSRYGRRGAAWRRHGRWPPRHGPTSDQCGRRCGRSPPTRRWAVLRWRARLACVVGSVEFGYIAHPSPGERLRIACAISRV